MRIFQARLVCDHCTGMFLTVEDFTRAITASETVIVKDDTATQLGCPRCDKPMQACRVFVGRFEIEVEIAHCKAHGLWFGRDLLEDSLAKVGAHGHRGAGGRGGMIGGSLSGAGTRGMGTAMAAVDAAFARGGNRNSHEPLRWWEKSRPRVITPFASSLTHQDLVCPACNSKLHLHGNQWGCDAGDGVFVENEPLAGMISEMANAPWELPPAIGEPGSAPCPACSVGMVEQEVEEVLVHRCAAHGIWFHAGELERTLRHTAEPKTGWFRRLFWPP